MKNHLIGWLIVSAAIVLQFLLELTLGRIFIAPAILVPVLVYLAISDSNYWAIEGAFWSGFAIDLLLHQPIGISSLAMLSGIAFSNWILRKTTGALEMTFVVNALLASLITDILFVLLACQPMGSGFSFTSVLFVPRILFTLLLYLAVPILSGRRNREFG